MIAPNENAPGVDTSGGVGLPGPPLPARAVDFGSIQRNSGSGCAVNMAILVAVVGAALWFHSASMHLLWERLGRVRQTLTGILLNPPDESKVIILALLALAAGVFVRLVADRRQLRREEVALAALRARLRQPASNGLLQDLTTVLADQPRDSVLVRAVAAVWQVRNLQTPDLEAISASVFVLEARRSGIGRTAANRLLLLSLLGTIIGLAGVIGTLQSQIGAAQGGDVNALLSNLQGTLTTMGTAFASTAYGILLAVFISVHASQVNGRRSQHVAEVQYFAVCELAPLLLPVSLPQAIVQIEALVWQSEAFVAESRTLLDETRVRNVAYLQELDQKTRASARMTADVVAGIEKTIRDAAKEVHDALADAGKYVVDGAKAQIDVAKRLDSLLGQSTTSMANAAADLKSGMQDLAGASNTVQSAYTGLNAAVYDLKTSLDGQAKTIGEAARSGLENAAKAAAAQQAATAAVAQQAATAANNQQAATEKQAKDLAGALQGVTDQLTDFLRRAEPKFPSDQEWSRLQKTLERCAEASSSFATAADRLGRDGLAGQRAASAPSITSAEMQQLLTSVTRQITDSISSAPDSLRGDLRTLSQDLRQAIQRMEQLGQQAAQRRPEQPLYRPQSAAQDPRPAAPNAYGNSSPPDIRYGQQVQRPPTIPAAEIPVIEKRHPSWQFWKKG